MTAQAVYLPARTRFFKGRAPRAFERARVIGLQPFREMHFEGPLRQATEGLNRFFRGFHSFDADMTLGTMKIVDAAAQQNEPFSIRSDGTIELQEARFWKMKNAELEQFMVFASLYAAIKPGQIETQEVAISFEQLRRGAASFLTKYFLSERSGFRPETQPATKMNMIYFDYPYFPLAAMAIERFMFCGPRQIEKRPLTDFGGILFNEKGLPDSLTVAFLVTDPGCLVKIERALAAGESAQFMNKFIMLSDIILPGEQQTAAIVVGKAVSGQGGFTAAEKRVAQKLFEPVISQGTKEVYAAAFQTGRVPEESKPFLDAAASIRQGTGDFDAAIRQMNRILMRSGINLAECFEADEEAVSVGVIAAQADLTDRIEKERKTLGVKEHATEQEIINAFRRRSKECHPDGKKGNSDKEMAEVNKAYELLSLLAPKQTPDFWVRQGEPEQKPESELDRQIISLLGKNNGSFSNKSFFPKDNNIFSGFFIPLGDKDNFGIRI